MYLYCVHIHEYHMYPQNKNKNKRQVLENKRKLKQSVYSVIQANRDSRIMALEFHFVLHMEIIIAVIVIIFV